MKINLKCINGEYYLNGRRITPEKSLKYRNHSPTGFNHGYGGSGPAQLALAVLLEITDRETAFRHYQSFKWKEIAVLPVSMDFDVTINMEDYIGTSESGSDQGSKKTA